MSLTVQSQFYPYSVDFYEGLSEALYTLADDSKSIFLIDQKFFDLYSEPLLAHLSKDRMILIEATERAKSFENLTPIFLELLSRGIQRKDLLVVVGGGILQDIGCFIASVLFRGLRWALVPTTLLAQADSCIGSKSSVNLGSFKNQIGTFYPPQRVLLTPEVLGTLSDEELRSGLGEIIKLQMIAGAEGFRRLMQDLSQGSLSQSLLFHWTYESLLVKKKFIEEDEFDRSIRNILNFGHTFGHAFEAVTQFKIPHGIAVLLGIDAELLLSYRFGYLNASDARSLSEQLQPWYKPFHSLLLDFEIGAIAKPILQDKKNSGGKVNCILTKGLGHFEKVGVDFERDIKPCLAEFLSRISSLSVG